MKRLNKKGFTLVELLAAIVILAVLMLVGAQAVSGIMRSSRANSLKSSLDAAVKQTNLKIAQDTLTNGDELDDVLTYDKDEYKVNVYINSDYTKVMTVVTPTVSGGFKSVRCNHGKVNKFKKTMTSAPNASNIPTDTGYYCYEYQTNEGTAAAPKMVTTNIAAIKVESIGNTVGE